MKLDKIYVIGLIILLALLLVLVSLLTIKSLIYKPTVDTGVPFTDADPLSPSPEITEGIVTAPAETTAPPEFVRERDKYLFLAVGVDKASGRGDAIMLVSFDVAKGDIAVMQIPRDTYIEFEGAEIKINEILFLRDVYAIRDIIEITLCVNIDYTALIDLEALEVMVDSVGGVEIDVPFDMKYSDPYQDLYIDLKAGRQILDGKRATDFIRFRSNYADGDLGRIDAQKQFMSSLFHKVMNEMNVLGAVTLAKGILPMLETDLTLDDAAYFAGKFFSAKERKLTMLTAPGFPIPGGAYYILSKEGALEAVNTYFNVYDNKITENLFDPSLILCKEEDDDFLRIYKYSMLPPRPVEG
ncbi:MAG: LCP family protein [Clostridia bacterium]|nr:LCP family protein [Clostridia bacterium]